MIYDIKECGKRIHQLRVQSGLSQECLAEKLNIDRSFLSRVEAGKKGCSVDLFVQLSECFNVSLDCIIMGKGIDIDKTQVKAEIKRLIRQLECLEASL